jgi:hypothetical protein
MGEKKQQAQKMDGHFEDRVDCNDGLEMLQILGVFIFIFSRLVHARAFPFKLPFPKTNGRVEYIRMEGNLVSQALNFSFPFGRKLCFLEVSQVRITAMDLWNHRIG